MKDRKISQPFEFLWRVPAGGLEWIRAQPAPGALNPQVDKAVRSWFLIESLTTRVPNIYRPLEQFTGLFRTFAETQPNRDAILGFARAYGVLGDTFSQHVLAGKRKKEQPVLVGENLNDWEREILFMREVIRLWDAIRKGEVSTVKTFIEWKGDTAVFCTVKTELMQRTLLIASRDQAPDRFLPFKPRDVIVPGWCALQRLVNEQLEKHAASPRLRWNANELQMSMCPRTLIAALWLQFATAVSSKHAYRTCAGCTTWFQIGRNGDRRADAQFCSNACKQKRYRERGNNKKVRRAR